MMYNPYQANPFGGFQSPFSPMVPQAQPQQAPAANTLPPQQILQANGKASIDALRMAPNSSVLIMDTTAPVVWLCATDGLGNVTATPYDIKTHVDPAVAATEGLEARVAAVEATVNTILARWEEMSNGGKPDASGTKQQQDGRAGGPDRAN